MEPIPAEIKIPYDAALAKKDVPLPAHFHYRRWLRYYLGFCLKYRYEILKEENLLYFLKKLKDKNQTEQQQKQAFHAVSILYEIENIDQDRIGALKNKKENISTKKTALDATHVDWSPVYRNLDSEIKLRHYSPRTLEAYKGWVRQLQMHTWGRVLNGELWTFYQGEEVAIPGKPFLFDGVLLVAYPGVHRTNRASITRRVALSSLGQFKMAGKVALTWPGGWSILRIKDVRAGNAWKGPREE